MDDSQGVAGGVFGRGVHGVHRALQALVEDRCVPPYGGERTGTNAQVSQILSWRRACTKFTKAEDVTKRYIAMA